jgi:hypothetical protein
MDHVELGLVVEVVEPQLLVEQQVEIANLPIMVVMVGLEHQMQLQDQL